MGVYVKGMPMPTDCYDCDFFNNGYECSVDGNNSFSVEYEYANRKLHKDCPLIEIPTPHGRLIDADALRPSFIEEYETSDVFVYRYYTEEDLASAPTIIEREGER